MITPLEFIHSNRKPLIWVGAVVGLLVILTAAWNVGAGKSSSGLAFVTSSNEMAFGGSDGMVAQDSDSYAPSRAEMGSALKMMPAPMPPTAGATAADVDQKIIKTGNLSLVVEGAEAATKRLSEIAKEHKGFVQSSSVSERADGTHAGNITVRVPADKFETALTQIKAAATVVKEETVSGQDVTEQYTDLQARLKNAKAQEETYLEVLKQARSVEDILKVQERLGYIRAEIESMQGRLQYLENVTAYSTISVYLEEEPTVRAPTKEFRPLALAKESVQTLISTLQALATGLIKLLIVGGGLLLPILLIVWALYTLAKKRNQG